MFAERAIYMETIQLVAPCHFGMEAVLKREIYDLGYEITKVEDGRVTFEGDEEAICRSNIFLRTAERVMVQIGRFHATTFDELYENMKALPWEKWIPQDGKFWVKKASSVKDTSGFSQKPSEDNSVGNAQEFAEMNNNSEETDEDYYTYEEPSYEENDEYYYQPEEPAEYDYSEDYAG